MSAAASCLLLHDQRQRRLVPKRDRQQHLCTRPRAGGDRIVHLGLTMTNPKSPTPKTKKKAQNGAGTVERRGALWWVRVSAPGMPRKRVPIAESEKMTEPQARKAGARIAADVRAGRIVFDQEQRPSAVGPSADWQSVRLLGAAWTSGEMFKRFGRVNKLRVKAGAEIDRWTLDAHVYEAKTRERSGPSFGDLPIAAI